MEMYEDLLAEARDKLTEARKRARITRQVADDAEDEVRRLGETVITLEGIKREHDDFNRAASDLLR